MFSVVGIALNALEDVVNNLTFEAKRTIFIFCKCQAKRQKRKEASRGRLFKSARRVRVMLFRIKHL